MPTQLNDFELKLLDRIIPTQTLSDTKSAQIAIRNFIGEQKESIMAERGIGETDFRTFQMQTVKNIFLFLKEKEFIGERDGGVTFLTEKGKNLRKQGSLEQYEVWRKQVRAENKVILHTIETRGYLDQDEVNRNRRAIIIQRIKKFVLYPLMLLILLAFLIVGAHKYKLDDNVPFIKNFFDKQTSTDKNDKDKDDGDGDKKTKQNKKKKHTEE